MVLKPVFFLVKYLGAFYVAALYLLYLMKIQK